MKDEKFFLFLLKQTKKTVFICIKNITEWVMNRMLMLVQPTYTFSYLFSKNLHGSFNQKDLNPREHMGIYVCSSIGDRNFSPPLSKIYWT